MHSKRRHEPSSCEGSSRQGCGKRLLVNQHQKSLVPRVRYLEFERETREITPSLSSGLSALAPATGNSREQLMSCDKKVVDPTKGRNRREVVMWPPKPIRTAILLTGGLDGISEPIYFDNQITKIPHKHSRPPPKNLDDEECRLLHEIIQMDNKVGFRDNEGTSKSAENALEAMGGFGLTGSKEATQSEKSVRPSVCEKSLEAGEEHSIVWSSERNRLQSNSRFHLVGGNSITGGTNYDDQTDLCRDKVMKVLDLFKDTLKKVQLEQKMKPNGQRKGGVKMYMEAARQLKEKHLWLNVNKSIGAVPGVEIGDHFQSRAELVIIGLHKDYFAGIDYMNIDGKLLATSIVASDRYGDKNESSDVLTYMGEGGNHVFSSSIPEDQKLVRGNLALKNSKDKKAPVRVIRSGQNIMKESRLIYDGLYLVTDFWNEVEPGGRLVYKFQLNRMQGQQNPIRLDAMKGSRKFNKASHASVVLNDISKGKENTPVRLVNIIDCEKPPPFKYTTKMMYHSQEFVVSRSSGCDCLDGCSEDNPCPCIIKNNCRFSVNNCVSTAEKEPIVYECGPCCKCPSGCKNRLSQNGIKLQLEVFKTIPGGWGVRSRNFISKGRFICEYVGELLQFKEEEGRIDFDESAVDAGNFYGTEDSSSFSEDNDDVENVKFGNVGRFIRHSFSPNLYAKCVLFDHEDTSRPHVMLFAAKNIAPHTEMTFNYKLW
ncbi:hypothetical protein DCAR_0416265 [Daucus carota subsp. sativus]|uniref:Uncharacterized protein n=2 Tax=Daucus carota subsp. sativus TaxID=79200 RepID=A0AAF0WXS8_DAUCS|nr:hypothetical protein DCAR_0416265 [Daucus carota subsp. sativus]